MKIGKTVQRRIRRRNGGIDVLADVNAAVAANVGEGSSGVSVSSRQNIVQRSGRTTSGGRTSTHRKETT